MGLDMDELRVQITSTELSNELADVKEDTHVFEMPELTNLLFVIVKDFKFPNHMETVLRVTDDTNLGLGLQGTNEDLLYGYHFTLGIGYRTLSSSMEQGEAVI